VVGGPGLGVVGRGQAAKGTVGSEGVVLDPPVLDQDLGLELRYEDQNYDNAAGLLLGIEFDYLR
jgi:hypothetical protein